MLKYLVGKFICGDTPQKALEKARSLMEQGFLIDLNIIGEDEESSELTFRKYYGMIQYMKGMGIFTDISLKLSHFGVFYRPDLVATSILHLAEELKQIDRRLTIDMEDTGHDFYICEVMNFLMKNKVINAGLAFALNREYVYLLDDQNIAVDLRSVSKSLNFKYSLCGFRRICKGAYYKNHKKRQEIIKNENKLSERYIYFFRKFISEKTYVGLAVVRDLKLIEKIKLLVKEQNIPKNAFEFQMLYGLRMDVARKLLKEGYKVRIYLPFLYNESYKKALSYFWRRCSLKNAVAVMKEWV